MKSGPCASNCTNDTEIYGLDPGGANVGLCDGFVRFLRLGPDVRVGARLVARAGNPPPRPSSATFRKRPDLPRR